MIGVSCGQLSPQSSAQSSVLPLPVHSCGQQSTVDISGLWSAQFCGLHYTARMPGCAAWGRYGIAHTRVAQGQMYIPWQCQAHRHTSINIHIPVILRVVLRVCARVLIWCTMSPELGCPGKQQWQYQTSSLPPVPHRFSLCVPLTSQQHTVRLPVTRPSLPCDPRPDQALWCVHNWLHCIQHLDTPHPHSQLREGFKKLLNLLFH